MDKSDAIIVLIDVDTTLVLSVEATIAITPFPRNFYITASYRFILKNSNIGVTQIHTHHWQEVYEVTQAVLQQTQ
jgi:hypothetical protein